MCFLKSERPEAESKAKAPQHHEWEDTEEPATCEVDKHVAERLKCEFKKPFPSETAYGADL